MRNDDWDVNAESYSERKRAYERVDDECEDENTNHPMIGRMLYIQMELCKMTLKEAIKKINLELGQKIGEPITEVGAYIATQFFYEIVSGVDYLHSQSPPIIHRDLKPGNIFITDGRDGNFIKIGDFGIAVTHGSDNNVSSEDVSIKDYIKHTQQQGTIGYMAPEVKELSKYNEKCDIYSLGCIALDLFCINKDVVNDW
jgi:serine/threonine protein kinase